MPSFGKIFHRQVYRRLKYALTRPVPLKSSPHFTGPVVVVGSAPVSHKPVGLDASYGIISINGSQTVIDRWGIDEPHITLMQPRQIESENTNAIEVRRVLNGLRTKRLYVFLWRKGLPQLKEAIAKFNYTFGHLEIVDRYDRIALIDRVTGIKSFEIDTEDKYSNGIIGVMFALHQGATAVIITGINPDSSGHIYNTKDLPRLHMKKDREILVLLRQKGFPIYTADPEVSASTGIPIWQGQTA
jgi:hypothetical protein